MVKPFCFARPQSQRLGLQKLSLFRVDSRELGDRLQPRTSLNGRLYCRIRRIFVEVCEELVSLTDNEKVGEWGLPSASQLWGRLGL